MTLKRPSSDDNYHPFYRNIWKICQSHCFVLLLSVF
jgi:hypothetical protein